ncbi:MAG: hypothetical protein M3P83_02130 [Actinomycetota bacterium]|nr:hypothetical protein [Actinomycetota bacterium]
MARRVFLHVGTPKSGTSFLQAVAHGNAAALRAQGLLVPFDHERHYEATLAIRDVVAAAGRKEQAARGWRLLRETVGKWDADALITHELLAAADTDQAGGAVAALAPAEVHVVITARDLLRQVPAEWQEHVKHGSTLDLVGFVEQVIRHGPAATWFWKVQHVGDLARRWARHVPAEQMHLVTVPPAGAPPDVLWRRFATVLGVDPGCCSIDVVRANESLGAAQVEFLRLVNLDRQRFFTPAGQHRWFKDRLAQQVLSQQPEQRRFGIGAAAAGWAAERSREMARELQDAGYRVVGSLDDLVLRPPLDVRPPPQAGTDELLSVGLQATLHLLALVRDEATARQQLRRKLDQASQEQQQLRERLDRWERRPVRERLILMSADHPSLTRVRHGYWRLADAARWVARLVRAGGRRRG